MVPVLAVRPPVREAAIPRAIRVWWGSRPRTFALEAAPPKGPTRPGGCNAGFDADADAARSRPWISHPTTYASMMVLPDACRGSPRASAAGRHDDVPWVGGN